MTLDELESELALLAQPLRDPAPLVEAMLELIAYVRMLEARIAKLEKEKGAREMERWTP